MKVILLLTRALRDLQITDKNRDMVRDKLLPVAHKTVQVYKDAANRLRRAERGDRQAERLRGQVRRLRDAIKTTERKLSA